MAHEHAYTRSKPDATVETCHCGSFRHTEHSGPVIVGFHAVVTVTRIPDLARFEYTCDARSAAIAAYAQHELKDFNTWDYDSRYASLVRETALNFIVRTENNERAYCAPK